MLHRDHIRTALVICSSIFVILIVIVYRVSPRPMSVNNNLLSKKPQPETRRRRVMLTADRLAIIYANISRNGSRCKLVGFANTTPGRLGNYMFFYAGVMYVAWLTGRSPCFWTKPHRPVRRDLYEVFDLDIKRINVKTLGCPFHTFKQEGVYTYDKRVESLIGINDNVSLWLRGHFCSWKYTQPIASQLRQRLRFRKELTEFAADFLATSVPPGWTGLEFVRVGVHVRRGDYLAALAQSRGVTVAGERYLQRAMSYFVGRFPRVQFIVASNDIPWCQKHVKLSMFNSTDVNITFSVKHNAGQDLALLASCDHTVMTTGTFSWWAAWLANGTTVYYANFPRRGSWLSDRIRSKDIYHPDWIGFRD